MKRLFFLLLLSSPALEAQSPAITQRLAGLRAAYEAAYQKEVSASHATALKDLDAKYTAALDRALSAATQAGQLDTAVALRDEKKRVTDGGALPPDDFSAPETLKTLRLTYRSAVQNLEVRRDQAAEPTKRKYEQALEALQTELTKTGDLDGALAVKAARESQGTPATVIPHDPPSQPPGSGAPAPSSKTKGKYDPAAAQALIDWVFQGNGTVLYSTNGGITSTAYRSTDADKLPKGGAQLVGIQHGGPGYRANATAFPWDKLTGVPGLTLLELQQVEPVTAEQITHLGGVIGNLQRLHLGSCTIPEDVWPLLPSGPNLSELVIGVRDRPLNAVDVKFLDLLRERYPNLENLCLPHRFNITEQSVPQIMQWKKLKYLSLSGQLTAQSLEMLGSQRSLFKVELEGKDSTIDPAGIRHLKNITHLNFQQCPQALPAVPEIALLSEIVILTFRDTGFSSSQLQLFAGHKRLERLALIGESGIDDTGAATLATIKNLIALDLRGTAITDAGLLMLKDLKKLTEVKCADTQVTATGVAALRKALPKCKVIEK